jgi:myo-inositol-1(or 4)-monophosphatase
MSTIDLKKALSVAVEAAALAGAHAVKRQNGELGIKTKASPRDFVTEVDQECQDMIIQRIQKDFPDHRFLGEEGDVSGIGDASSPYRWIIDPIDGTGVFIHGRDNFGNLIALEENEEVILAVMHQPRSKDFFTGVKGGGAFWNDKKVTLRETKDLNDAILCCNIINRAKKNSDGVLTVTLPAAASVENYGAAVDEFGKILRGENDGAFFENISLWDIAAGCFLVTEAGGKAEYRKNSKGKYDVACSTTPIFEELKKFVFERM